LFKGKSLGLGIEEVNHKDKYKVQTAKMM
jgi:hypothetical protein